MKLVPYILVIAIISIGLLFLVYWFPPIELQDSAKFISESPVYVTNKQLDLVIEEHQKVVSEIQDRSRDNTQWFYYKFLLVGVIIGSVLAYYLKGGVFSKENGNNNGRASNDDQSTKNQVNFFELIKKEIFLVTAGLAFIISVSIDIYISQNTIMTMQLGNWVAYQYEPLTNNVIPTDSVCSPKFRKDFIGWEHFLRIEADREDYELFISKIEKSQNKKVTGQHKNIFCSLFHFPSYYFLSWLVYFLFLTSFYHRVRIVAKYKSKQKRKEKKNLVSILISAHIMIMLFSVMSRAVPNIYYVKALIFPLQYIREYVQPWQSAIIFNFPVAVLILIINLLFYKREISR